LVRFFARLSTFSHRTTIASIRTVWWAVVLVGCRPELVGPLAPVNPPASGPKPKHRCRTGGDQGMHVERTERSIGELMGEISRSEIKLPELQREFVWKPTQVAKLMDSLYRGFPSGSLLFWEPAREPVARDMAIDERVGRPGRPPLFLLDGQQRLTSLHRVFSGHPDAQIVFNVDTQRFQNQSATTKSDARWVRLADLLRGDISMLRLTKDLIDAGCTLPDTEIERRLRRVTHLRDYAFRMEILKGFSYEEIAEIFVRVNSGGRHLGTLDLAMATLSARWPGVLEKLQKEADFWRRRGYGDIDVNFLSRAFAGVVLGRGLSAWSHGQLAAASDDELEKGWATVQRGLRSLEHLLRGKLRLTRSDPLPSMIVLIPLVVLLGEWPDAPMDTESANAVIYWFLVATIRARYSGSTDTKLSQDIRAARRDEPIKALLRNLDVFESRPQVTAQSLAGRTKESPYFFLSLLVAQLNGARDWWYGTELLLGLGGEHRLEHHHVHPVATLDDRYDKAEINDLANLVFISAKANRRISNKPPKVYFPELGSDELAAHYVPLDDALRDADGYLEFLAERRRLLAAAMTDLLDSYRPRWLDKLPLGPAATTDGLALRLVLYASAWDSGRLVFTASGPGIKWTGSASMADLEQGVVAAGVAGIDSDVEIAGESVPVQVVEDSVEVRVGPFLVTGTPEEWAQVFDRERRSARSLASYQPAHEATWSGDAIRFPVSSTD
jgi:hypothetical protein